MCPVLTLRNHFIAEYNGVPTEPLFQSGNKQGAPWTRTAFSNELKARLIFASRHLNIAVNPTDYSAISFRKGGLSALAGGVATNHLADHADHADIASTREYTAQTIEERAGHTAVIASRYNGVLR